MRDKLIRELEKIKQAQAYRRIPEIEEGGGKYVQKKGKYLLNLASNNYLGLSCDCSLISASRKALELLGCSSGASRVVTGNFSLYDELEKRTARFKSLEDCLVINSGYTANLAVLTTLAGRRTVVFSDKLNHASIVDGIRLSGAEHVRYRHSDMAHLKELLDKYKDTEEKIIVTDTVFSMDGDRAELADIVNLAGKYKALTIVDEAHATGVLGQGRGLAHELGLEHKIDVHMGTYSKAFGSFGAYLAGDSVIIDYIRNRGRQFIFTTSLPPSVIGADMAALDYVCSRGECGCELLSKSEYLRNVLKKLGYDTGMSSTQIIPVILKDNGAVLKAAVFLEEEGIIAGAIRPPTVPENTARLRLSMRNDICVEEIEKVVSVFRRLKNV
jgi:8-amino-7-oxononanoate synthase